MPGAEREGSLRAVDVFIGLLLHISHCSPLNYLRKTETGFLVSGNPRVCLCFVEACTLTTWS